MPTGVYIRTEKTREILSKANKGKKLSEEHKRKIGEANKRRGFVQGTGFKKGNTINLGKKVKYETKVKIGKANSVEKVILKCLFCNKNKLVRPFEQKKRKFCSTLCFSKFNKAENTHTWKGGITREIEKIRHSTESKEWQKSVKERDNNTCKKCGEDRCKYTTAHHVLNFSSHIELRFDINNGITFCRSCHKLFHMTYGYKNNTREQLEEFIA